MTKFVTYNETTRSITGFYGQEASVPSDVLYIEITDEQWDACLRNPGYTVQDKTLVPPVEPTASQILTKVRIVQNKLLTNSYHGVAQQPVSYTNQAGVTQTYQADPRSVSALQLKVGVLQPLATVPSGFYWIATDNTKVPFTYKDLQGLLIAIDQARTKAFQKLQTLKASVNANTNIDIIKQTIWS